ncbi:MAG: inositol 2-dehydrogenase [Geminicoccales bacterium]
MIKFAVLGCGRIGRMHAANLARHPRAELAWVFDVAAGAAASVAEATGARQARAIDEILADKDVGAVLIASSTNTHLDLLVGAVEAGKAVLCEKPIDLDLAKVDATWQRIRDRNATIMVGFNRRFDPSFKALRDRIQQGEIGKLEQVVITSRDPGPPPIGYIEVSGGLFRDMTIHDFDMARYLMGEIVSVFAVGANLVDPAIESAGDIDAAMIILEGAGGALCHINNSRRCAYGYDQRIEAFGEHGMLQAENQRPTSIQAWGTQATEANDPVLNFFIERYTPAYMAEIDHFVDCCEKGTAPLASYRDGREALRLADAALESMTSGQTVRLDGTT